MKALFPLLTVAGALSAQNPRLPVRTSLEPDRLYVQLSLPAPAHLIVLEDTFAPDTDVLSPDGGSQVLTAGEHRLRFDRLSGIPLTPAPVQPPNYPLISDAFWNSAQSCTEQATNTWTGICGLQNRPIIPFAASYVSSFTAPGFTRKVLLIMVSAPLSPEQVDQLIQSALEDRSRGSWHSKLLKAIQRALPAAPIAEVSVPARIH
jgi:hypothetical protein